MPRGKHIKLIIGVDGTCQVDAIDLSAIISVYDQSRREFVEGRLNSCNAA